jgi:hypothetical protein
MAASVTLRKTSFWRLYVPTSVLQCAMVHDIDRNIHLKLIAQLRKRIQQVEADIIAQNETIALLERSGRNARHARAVRAQLWMAQEGDLAEMDRLLEEMSGPGREQ